MRLFVGVLGIMFLAGSAHAYRILSPRVHEAITLAASYCADEAKLRDAMPSDCSPYRDRIASYSRLQYSLTSLQREVRWPDDPRREMKSAGFIKPLQNGKWKACQGKLRRSRAVQHIGTFCASHFGEWQFMHAMSVSRPDGNGGIDTDDFKTTRGKVLEWAAFAYEVARGDLKPTDNYCDAFRDREPIRGVMVPKDFPFCSRRNPWTVGTYLSIRCGQLLFIGWCRPLKPEDEFVKTVAKGALLHLIQDSYSQSHVRRVNRTTTTERGGPAPVIECGKPREYFVYDKPNQLIHDDADQVPKFGKSCSSGAEADDVITASAMALAYLDRNAPTAEFLRYLEAKVF